MVILEIEKTEIKNVQLVLDKIEQKDVEYIEKKNFDGQSLIDIIIPLTTFAIPIIAKVIIENIKSKKHIEVNFKGTKIRGISENNVIKILKELKDNED